MLDQWDRARLDFGDAVAHLRALRQDDDDLPRACDRVMRLAETVADVLRSARESGRAARRNSRAAMMNPLE